MKTRYLSLVLLIVLSLAFSETVIAERVYVFDISVAEGGTIVNVTMDRLSITGYNGTRLLVTDFIEGVTSNAKLYDFGTEVVPYARAGNIVVGRLGNSNGFIFNSSHALKIAEAPCYDVVKNDTYYYAVCGSYLLKFDDDLNVFEVKKISGATLSGVAIVNNEIVLVGTLNGDTGLIVIVTPSTIKAYTVEAPSYLSDVCIYKNMIYAVGGSGDDVLLIAVDPASLGIVLTKVIAPKSPTYVSGCVASDTDLWIVAQIDSYLANTGGRDILLIRIVDSTVYGFVLGSPSNDLAYRKMGLWMNGTEICLTFTTYEKPNAPNIFVGCLPAVAEAIYLVNEDSYYVFTPTDLTYVGSVTVSEANIGVSSTSVATQLVAPAIFTALIRNYYVYTVGTPPSNATTTTAIVGGWPLIQGWELDRSSQILFDTLMATILTLAGITVIILGWMHGWRTMYVIAILVVLGLSIALAVARAAIPTKVELMNGEYHYVYEKNTFVHVYLAPIMVASMGLLIAISYRMVRETYVFA